MPVKLKFHFEKKSQFLPHYSDPCPIFLCDDGAMVCGRDFDAQMQVFMCHQPNSWEFAKVGAIDDEINTYVVCPFDNTIIFATKNMFLHRFDRSSQRILSKWNSYHTKPICLLALNNSATRLATGSTDGTIRIWHIGDREGFVASCKLHTSKITLLRFHPAKALLFSCSMGEVDLIVWNTETGAKVTTLVGHQGNVTDIAFSPSEEQFATCGHDKVVLLWSTENMHRTKIIPTFESLQTLAYLPPGSLSNHLPSKANRDASFLITGGQWGIVRVWNTKTSQCVLELRGPTNHSSDSAALKNLDFGMHSVSRLTLFHVSAFPENPEVLLLTRQSSHVELYNADTLKLFHEFVGEIGPVDKLCLVGAQGNRLVLADASANLKLFVRPPSATSSSGSWACQLVQSPHFGVIGDMAASTCGQWLLTGGHDQSLSLWQLIEPEDLSGRPKLLSRFFAKNAHDAHISAVSFARDTSVVFSASTDGILKTWSVHQQPSEASDDVTCTLNEGQSVRNAHDGAINCMHVSVNGKFLATGSRDKTAKIWSLESVTTGGDMLPRLVGSLVGHSRGVWSVCFSDHERVLLTASGDKDLRLWNLKDLSCIRTFEGHEEPVYQAVFISKGRQILSCDQRGLVRLWNLSSKGESTLAAASKDARPPNVLEAHEGRIWTIAVCPDETGFYTGGEDATICFFRDTSDDTAQDRAVTMEEFTKIHQEFDNLLKSKRFSEALRLAVKLDKPQRTYEILHEISLLEGISPGDGAGVHRPLEKALFGLIPEPPEPGQAPSEEMAQRLLKYAVNWNTRARTCLVAQRVFNWIISNWAPERLLAWPGIANSVTAFIPYTVRHYQRLNRLEEQMAVLDYLFDESRCNQIIEWTESLEGASDRTPNATLSGKRPSGTCMMEVDEVRSVNCTPGDAGV
uniref:WD_REPEATS_REGION domain-containing protein n=3 Tax=Mesocestoides corti TaxID=53468 RepID=A0A5K3EJ03_MESCO